MTDKQYKEALIFRNIGGFLEPVSDSSKKLLSEIGFGKELILREVSQRDLKFHRAYFEFLNTVYDYLPNNFKSRIPKDLFYIFLKELQGKYRIIYKFKSGSEMKEYESIAFDKMTQLQFEDYVREQLPHIYDLIITLFDKQRADAIIQTIEEDFKIFLNKLNK